jgi:predicted AAA+ superfamily ATPase
VVDREFQLVQPYRQTATGGYVMVQNGGRFPNCPDRIRVQVSGPQGYSVVSGEMHELNAVAEPEGVVNFSTVTKPDIVLAGITDEEIVDRLKGRFEVLREMTKAVKAGTVRAMIVTGPPGVGKSYGVEEVLSKDDLFDVMGQRKPRYEFVKGAMSAIGLYKKLYEYSDAKNILVFDDCDSILLDDVSLNILKAALDSSKKRTISWNTDSRLLRSEGIPDSFEFKGGAIFITNLKFENVRSKKLQDHLAALESRCHYIDLQMDTDREKVLRIKQIVFNPEAGQEGILDAYEFEDAVKDEIVDFIVDHRCSMRELSLRTVLKVADLRKSFPVEWRRMSEVTVMKGRA